MNSKPRPIFSIIVPTRNRPDGLRRLLDSFKATTADLDTLEVILVIDGDDKGTLEFVYEDFPLKRIVLQPGLKMGELNMAGYQAAAGDYIMLLNDDVILRTRHWDKKIVEAFKEYSDGIVLVHVNDKIFEEKLCTFPFVSRKYCELADGICPRDYVRYRIDDHIYNVFNLLAVMGKVRILYLPEVVFEHTNYVLTALGSAEYRPDQKIHALDTRRFDDLLPARKNLAVQLIDYLDQHSRAEHRSVRQKLLDQVTDSVSLRRPEYVRIWSDGGSLSSDKRVTIGVVSANIRSDHARTCVDLIKKFTANFDLVILDNNGRAPFNHPHEMNKLLSMCDTDYLVLMDDDVFVEAGWLDGMLRCMTPSVGVVTPLHKDVEGKLSYAGVVMRPDYSGHHSHSFAAPERPVRIQTLCSAVLLVDMRKCGHLRFDESYSKYFLDIDFGLQVWSADYEVICSPYVSVTHIGGGTLQQDSSRSSNLFEIQRQQFVKNWIDTGRYQKLDADVWSKIPEILSPLKVSSRINELINCHHINDQEDLRAGALAFFRSIANQPALAQWSAKEIWAAVGDNPPPIADSERGHLAFLLGCTPCAVLIEQNFHGLNIVLYDARYFAIPQTERGFDYERIRRGEYSQIYSAESVAVLKARIRGGISDVSEIRTRRGSKFPGVFRESWSMLKKERSRFGSWKPAVRSVSKTFLKKRIIGVCGVRGFLTLKDIYWKTKTQKSTVGALPATWLGAKLILQLGSRLLLGERRPLRLVSETLIPNNYENSLVSVQGANPQRWLDASPIALIEEDYRGYSIYRFEYKYFALLGVKALLSYDDIVKRKYDSSLIAHSLREIHAAIDNVFHRKETNDTPCNLVLACLPPLKLSPLMKSYPPGSVAMLVEKLSAMDWGHYDTIISDAGTIFDWARAQNSNGSDPLTRRLLDKNFDCVTIPWSFPETWVDNSLETAASKISSCVEVLHTSGERRKYQGENLHRLVYNKAYLASMFQVLPPPQGKFILEAGCSDGLVCDILAMLGAEKVVGIDVMKTVGCSFGDDRIEYHVMDICRMNLPDQMFDMVYSIATFEHVATPHEALLEMLRVTKIDGYGYVQAGPLYHSPFGHHMFEYFKDEPWIHLRKSKDEIVSYAKKRGIDKSIERDLSMTCEQYVEGMLNVDHVNGLLLEEYGLDEFRRRNDVEILKFNISYEGGDLLTSEIAEEMRGVNPDRLVEHGFEIAFRKVR